MLVFGFFFVTVRSRIVGIIGTSSNPISGMTIATLMATCLVFWLMGWTGDAYQPMALCVGAIVCIAAANAGATSQDLKTGFLVGATPRPQQIGLVIGVLAAARDRRDAFRSSTTTSARRAAARDRRRRSSPAPQGTLMATLIKGLLAQNLDWRSSSWGSASPSWRAGRRVAARLRGRRLPAALHDLPDLPRRRGEGPRRQAARRQKEESDSRPGCSIRRGSSRAAPSEEC